MILKFTRLFQMTLPTHDFASSFPGKMIVGQNHHSESNSH